jgi:uncharacterized protein YjbI with pentapeptide repeats
MKKLYAQTANGTLIRRKVLEKQLEELGELGFLAWNIWREKNDIKFIDLSQMNFSLVDLTGVNFSNIDLTGAYFRGVNLSGASFINSNLTVTNLAEANLAGVDFTGTLLKGANLTWANLSHAKLNGTDFEDAEVGATTFVANDLSVAQGLTTVHHRTQSYISIDTIYRSNGNIPELFLRGAGVPESFLMFARSLTNAAFEYHSCFISYSSKNQDFADRLYADLQNKGVRCWFASEDLKIGDKIRPRIDETIRLHDKLLLVLSEYSVISQWVEQEVETALAKEREQGRMVLFPIRLDDTVMKINSGWPALIKNTRNIGDFTGWKSYREYRNAFERLLRDLQPENLL